MRERQLRNLAVACIFVMLFVVGLSYLTDIIPYDGGGAFDYVMTGEAQAGRVEYGDYILKKRGDYNLKRLNAKNKQDNAVDGDNNTVTPLEGTGDENVEAPVRIIVPKLAEGSTAELEDIYIKRQIRLTVNNSPYAAYTRDMILYDNNIVRKITVRDVQPKAQDGSASTIITLELDGVYAYNLFEENNQFIIEIKDIHSVYDKVLVIDAGHGGGDNGCGSCDGKHYEKEITLSIVKLLKERLDATDIKVYYTRLKDETVYLRPRVRLANDVKADMFISIHCNYYDRYPLYKVNGAETLYSSGNKNTKMMNRLLANIMLDKFTGAAAIKKRSVIDRKKELFILKKSHVPSAIVEMGYMSDYDDLKHFTNAKKRNRVVDGLYNGIVSAFDKMYGKTVPSAP